MLILNVLVESVASGEHKLQQVKAQLTQMRKDVQQMGNIVATSKRAPMSLLFHTICLRRMLVTLSCDCNRFRRVLNITLHSAVSVQNTMRTWQNGMITSPPCELSKKMHW